MEPARGGGGPRTLRNPETHVMIPPAAVGWESMLLIWCWHVWKGSSVIFFMMFWMPMCCRYRRGDAGARVRAGMRQTPAPPAAEARAQARRGPPTTATVPRAACVRGDARRTARLRTCSPIHVMRLASRYSACSPLRFESNVL